MAQQMTLGDLIRALNGASPAAVVRYSFGGEPCGVESYRGYYDHLSLPWQKVSYPYVTVATLLPQLREAVGATFTGYKGGSYRMGLSTPLWCSPYGDATSCAIVGADVTESWVRLDVAYIGGEW